MFWLTSFFSVIVVAHLDEKKAGERKGAANRHLSDLQRTAMPTVRGFVGYFQVKLQVCYLFAISAVNVLPLEIIPPPS